MSRGTQYLKENLPRLPLDVREAIVDSDYLDALQTIQERNKLHLDQAEELEDLTFRLMIGDIDQTEFPKMLEQSLRITSAQALDYTKQVDELVLSPIRLALENMDHTNDDIPEEETAEDHRSLSSAEILASIENPDPSIGEIHATTTPAASPVSIPRPTPQAQPEAKTTNSTASILQAAAANAAPAKPVTTPEETPAVSPAVAALNNKLTEQTISKPQEIHTSLDPYREKF